MVRLRARPPGYVDSFWLTALPPLSIAEALRLLVGVPLPERENSVKSWRDGSLYIATTETQREARFRQKKSPRYSEPHYITVSAWLAFQEKPRNTEARRLWAQNVLLSRMQLDVGSSGTLRLKQQTQPCRHFT